MSNLGDVENFYLVLTFMSISLPLLLVVGIVPVRVTATAQSVTSDSEKAREVSQVVKEGSQDLQGEEREQSSGSIDPAKV